MLLSQRTLAWVVCRTRKSVHVLPIHLHVATDPKGEKKKHATGYIIYARINENTLRLLYAVHTFDLRRCGIR